MKSSYQNMNPNKAIRIKELYFTGLWTQTELASMYEVSQSTIARAVSGYSWR